MSLQRTLNWSAALRGLHADRIQVAPGVRTAHSLIDGMARIRRTRLVTPTGAFDRAAIMVAAAEAARAHQRRYGSTWAAAMSVGLTAAWASARAAFAHSGGRPCSIPSSAPPPNACSMLGKITPAVCASWLGIAGNCPQACLRCGTATIGLSGRPASSVSASPVC